MLDVMMMLPPSFICGSPYRQARNAPRTCTAMTKIKRISGYSGTGATTPGGAGIAEEDVDLTHFRDRCVDIGFGGSDMAGVRRVAVGSHVRAGESARDARSRSLSRKSTSITRAPSRTKACAFASPTLPAPPVMMHTFRSSNPMNHLL